MCCLPICTFMFSPSLSFCGFLHVSNHSILILLSLTSLNFASFPESDFNDLKKREDIVVSTPGVDLLLQHKMRTQSWLLWRTGRWSCHIQHLCQLVTWPWANSIMFCTSLGVVLLIFQSWRRLSVDVNNLGSGGIFLIDVCTLNPTSRTGPALLALSWRSEQEVTKLSLFEFLLSDIIFLEPCQHCWNEESSAYQGIWFVMTAVRGSCYGTGFRMQSWRTASPFLVCFHPPPPDFNLKEQIQNCISWSREDRNRAQLFRFIYHWYQVDKLSLYYYSSKQRF